MITILLLLFLSIAVIMDLTSYKIKNYLILLGILFGVCYRIYQFQWTSIYEALMGFFIPFILLIPLYSLRVLGAGDIKLFMVIGLNLGWTFVSSVIIYSLFFGGVISLVYMVFTRQLIVRMMKVAQYIKQCLYLIYSKQLQHLQSYDTFIMGGISVQNYSNKIHFAIPILLAYLYLIIKPYILN